MMIFAGIIMAILWMYYEIQNKIMYINNFTLKRPSDQVLDKCHEVLIGDPAQPFWAMRKYCRDNDLSLLWAEINDVSDHSYQWDEMAAFYFIDAEDATIFTLKFK